MQSTTDVLQSAIGLRITKYDRAGLQITIGFGLQCATKILKIELQSAVGLQSETSLDYKSRWNYKTRRITKHTVHSWEFWIYRSEWVKQYLHCNI